MLNVSDPAPEFELPTDGDGTLSSQSLAGTSYVLYFYPKDNTPGCTTEACDFRDNLARLTGAGVTVLGVSRDSVESHDRFKAKHALPFTLLSDADLVLHKAYGAWGKKKIYGREFDGTIRSTFLVGSDGRIARVWPARPGGKVRVKGHVAEVIEALADLDG